MRDHLLFSTWKGVGFLRGDHMVFMGKRKESVVPNRVRRILTTANEWGS